MDDADACDLHVCVVISRFSWFYWYSTTLDPRKTAYNVLNAVGSAILAYIAFHPFQIGFVVLEVAWTLISVYALVRQREQE